MQKVLVISIILSVMLSGCRHTRTLTAPPLQGGSEVLYAYRWNVTAIHGQPVATGPSDSAYLLFYPGQVNRVSGSTGCNRLNGTYELSGTGTIRFSPLATTRMACAGKLEAQLLPALARVDTWRITGRQLLLQSGNTPEITLQGVSVVPSK